MDGFHDASYGDAFADVYDEWYGGISDVEATVRMLRALADGRPVLELGVGTGRLAVPLAAAGVDVTGIDSSAAMLDVLAAKASAVKARRGDMVDGLPDGPFGLVFVAYNTFFNLTTAARQQSCFDAVAARLAPGGMFVIEAAVPDPQRPPGGTVAVRSIAADRVVLSVDVHVPEEQRVDAQLIELTEAGGVRLRPASIRYAAPAELDAMAVAAGFEVGERWEDFAQSPFAADSAQHVTVYLR
jgi:SAM-dependent methyltransferase